MKEVRELIEKDEKYAKIMLEFKVKKCRMKENHRKQECMDHHKNDKRRSILDGQNRLVYLPYICYRCEDERDCRFSHSYEEQMFNPLRYKTEQCTEYNTKCGLVDKLYCPYYHNADDCRVEIVCEFNRLLKEIDQNTSFNQQD